MYKRLIAVAVVAAAVALGVGIWHTKGASAQNAPEAEPAEVAPTMAQIDHAALEVAAREGEPAPTSVEETSGTLAQTARAIDPQDAPPTVTDPRTGKPWSESAVYIVTMQGHFTYDGPLPRGQATPTGTTLNVVIDAKTGFVVTRSLGKAPLDLRQISPNVITLGD